MQGLHSPSLHTQRQLKEALYNQIINYFDQGKVSTARGSCSPWATPAPHHRRPAPSPPVGRVSLCYCRDGAGAALRQAGGSELGPDGSSLQPPQLSIPPSCTSLSPGPGEMWGVLAPHRGLAWQGAPWLTMAGDEPCCSTPGTRPAPPAGAELQLPCRRGWVLWKHPVPFPPQFTPHPGPSAADVGGGHPHLQGAGGAVRERNL